MNTVSAAIPATKPLVDLFNTMGNALLRPFQIPPAREAGHAPHSESELRELLGWLALDRIEVAERGDLAAPLLRSLGPGYRASWS